MPSVDQLLGPLGLTVALIAAVAYGGRRLSVWIGSLWDEHLRVDRERATALIAANTRVDDLRASNDANMRIVEKAVSQNERLLSHIIGKGGVSNED